MRLTPVDRPPTLLARLLFAAMRRLFGTVPTPYRVIFTRAPRTLLGHLGVVLTVDRRLTLDPELRLLLSTHVAALNGCTFCVDIARAVAVQRHVPREKLAALGDPARDHRLDDRERVALAYVEEVNARRGISDTTFERVRRHFDETAIVEMTWLTAVENYFNLQNVALGIESDGLCAIAERRAS